jgi:hypothetical protein
MRKLGDKKVQKKIGQKKIGMKKVVKSEDNDGGNTAEKAENGWDNDDDDLQLSKSETSDPKSETTPESEYESEYASEYASELESDYESYYSDESISSETEKTTDPTPKTPKTPKSQKTPKTVNTGQIQILTRQLAEALQQNNTQAETFKTDRKIMKADYEQKLLVVNQELSDTKERLEQTDTQLSAIKDQLRESAVVNQKEKDAADKNRRDTQHQIFKYRQKNREFRNSVGSGKRCQGKGRV